MARRNRNMCVRIARDVLEQLRLKRYNASRGIYVGINPPEDSPLLLDIKSEESFKTFFKKNKAVTCEVCALGSAFVSLVNIENKCSVGEMDETANMFDRLSGHFGNENLALMESAFECESTNNTDDDRVDYEKLELAVQWGRQYEDPTKRLRAIMLNVIRNNGDFKLPKKMLARAAAISAALDAGNDSW